MMEQFVEKGGNLIWFSAPPLIDGEGKNCSKQWQSLFGVQYAYNEYMGEMATAKKILFENSFANIAEQLILTDFLVDRIYPVTKDAAEVETLAKVENMIVGTKYKKGKGCAYYCGFRPRDDQSASLGYETRTLFEILHATNAYPSSGKFAVNDNPAYVSRTTDWLATKFPNGTTAIVKHYRTHRENWGGGFARNAESDAKALSVNPLPSDKLDIKSLKINGHEITYTGKMNMAFRTDENGNLIAFHGRECKGITIDGKQYNFSAIPVDITYSPVDNTMKTYQLQVSGKTKISLPLSKTAKNVSLKHRNKTIAHTISKGKMMFEITDELSGKWLDLKLEIQN